MLACRAPPVAASEEEAEAGFLLPLDPLDPLLPAEAVRPPAELELDPADPPPLEEPEPWDTEGLPWEPEDGEPPEDEEAPEEDGDGGCGIEELLLLLVVAQPVRNAPASIAAANPLQSVLNIAPALRLTIRLAVLRS